MMPLSRFGCQSVNLICSQCAFLIQFQWQTLLNKHLYASNRTKRSIFVCYVLGDKQTLAKLASNPLNETEYYHINILLAFQLIYQYSHEIHYIV